MAKELTLDLRGLGGSAPQQSLNSAAQLLTNAFGGVQSFAKDKFDDAVNRLTSKTIQNLEAKDNISQFGDAERLAFMKSLSPYQDTSKMMKLFDTHKKQQFTEDTTALQNQLALAQSSEEIGDIQDQLTGFSPYGDVSKLMEAIQGKEVNALAGEIANAKSIPELKELAQRVKVRSDRGENTNVLHTALNDMTKRITTEQLSQDMNVDVLGMSEAADKAILANQSRDEFINDATVIKNMSPEQAKNMRELRGSIYDTTLGEYNKQFAPLDRDIQRRTTGFAQQADAVGRAAMALPPMDKPFDWDKTKVQLVVDALEGNGEDDAARNFVQLMGSSPDITLNEALNLVGNVQTEGLGSYLNDDRTLNDKAKKLMKVKSPTLKRLENLTQGEANVRLTSEYQRYLDRVNEVYNKRKTGLFGEVDPVLNTLGRAGLDSYVNTIMPYSDFLLLEPEQRKLLFKGIGGNEEQFKKILDAKKKEMNVEKKTDNPITLDFKLNEVAPYAPR